MTANSPYTESVKPFKFLRPQEVCPGQGRGNSEEKCLTPALANASSHKRKHRPEFSQLFKGIFAEVINDIRFFSQKASCHLEIYFKR